MAPTNASKSHLGDNIENCWESPKKKNASNDACRDAAEIGSFILGNIFSSIYLELEKKCGFVKHFFFFCPNAKPTKQKAVVLFKWQFRFKQFPFTEILL